ncbi:hypothetical protein HaLaN_29817, partial [Haematococcus lacustris]
MAVVTTAYPVGQKAAQAAQQHASAGGAPGYGFPGPAQAFAGAGAGGPSGGHAGVLGHMGGGQG